MLSAYVFVEAAAGLGQADVAATHAAAHQVPGVKTVHFVMGRIDAIVYLEANDLDGLTAAVGQLHSVKGVARTETLLVMPM